MIAKDRNPVTGVHDVYNDFHPYEGLNDDDYKNF
jgi:hypothetical protein